MVYLQAKDPCGAKYQLLINKGESRSLNYFNDSEAFIECLNDMEDIYKNISLFQKNIRLNSTHYFVMKIPNKRELQQIAFHHYQIATPRLYECL